jgi:hypothetical protein
MRASQSAASIIFLFLAISCARDNNLLAPGNENLPLESAIVGKWSISGSEIFVFYANKTFVDSLWGLSTTRPGTTYLAFVGTGNFSVIDDILYLSDRRYTVYLDSEPGDPGYFVPGTPVQIELHGNQLVCQPLAILSPDSPLPPDLYGQWTETREVSWGKYSGPIYSGRVLTRYTFANDSLTCTVETRYLDGHPVSDTTITSQYIFHPPLLFFPITQMPNIRVEFKGDKMYWYYIHDAYAMTRE